MLYSKMAGAISVVRVTWCNGAYMFWARIVLHLLIRNGSKCVEKNNECFPDTCLSLFPRSIKGKKLDILVTECIWSLVEGDHVCPKRSNFVVLVYCQSSLSSSHWVPATDKALRWLIVFLCDETRFLMKENNTTWERTTVFPLSFLVLKIWGCPRFPWSMKIHGGSFPCLIRSQALFCVYG